MRSRRVNTTQALEMVRGGQLFILNATRQMLIFCISSTRPYLAEPRLSRATRSFRVVPV